ncbi:GTP cyclohydrolase II [uncultured Sphingomonas sp.]|uniref:GTP cyclohydrolase II n=1 Tax=uncultured Sphingomonas sp. TaxID=158754 RepID=UPI0035C9FA0D
MRRGWPITIAGPDGTIGLLAVETADRAGLDRFDPAGDAPVLLSAGRAATLKLVNQRAAAQPDAPVLVERAPWLDLDAVVALADPQLDLATPLKGPFRAIEPGAVEAMTAALMLVRPAGILPAFFVGAAEGEAVTPAAIAAFGDPITLVVAARARLPVAQAPGAEIVAFRGPDSPGEHVALIVGKPDGRPPLVRLHSECLTGDVFGSLKCDCGPQLHAAIAAMEDIGWGILLYLRQEGRGIGLINKMRAYALQDQGFDTVDANIRLGFAVDARDFRVAARMLDLLGQRTIRLMTNNPEKIRVLEAAGVSVAERVPISLPANPHNARYLATKRDRTGHQL